MHVLKAQNSFYELGDLRAIFSYHSILGTASLAFELDAVGTRRSTSFSGFIKLPYYP
jgi:hypothetical protein